MIQNFFDGEFQPHIHSELQNRLTMFHLKWFILQWIEYFSERGYKFTHIYEMNTTTISNERYKS